MTGGDDVELARDPYWWLHPAIRGRESLPGGAAGLPWAWQDEASSSADAATGTNGVGPYGDFAKLLYKLNGYRPGPVTGWYVIVSPEPGRFAVGQLRVDPDVPVVLFREHVYDSERDAREAAQTLRAAAPGLLHRG